MYLLTCILSRKNRVKYWKINHVKRALTARALERPLKEGLPGIGEKGWQDLYTD